MIDILLKHRLSFLKIKDFLSAVFGFPIERISVFDVEEFNSLTEELDGSAFDCICVVFPVSGDVSQLLQLYRYNFDLDTVVDRILAVAQDAGIHCYIPSDSSDVWICAGDGAVLKSLRQIESDEEDCFLFQVI